MADTVIKSTVKTAEEAFDIPVSRSGLTITVECSGDTIRVEGVDYTFADDETFVVTNRPEDTTLQGYIVIDTTPDPDEIRLFVDEVIEDGVDTPHVFTRGGQYKPFATLFLVKIPGNTSDLAGIDFNRWYLEQEV